MRDDLLGYYERELTFLRQMGAEFAEKYPKIAARLALEPERCEDPHVERMIEAFAFLASRVHMKIDDEFPEIAEALLDALYPSFLAPVPSLTVVQFGLDPDRVALQTGQLLPRGAMLASAPLGGVPCRFRTAYDVWIWPLEVVNAQVEAPDAPTSAVSPARSMLRIVLRTFGSLPFSQLNAKLSDTEERPLEKLRFFLQGEGKTTHGLLELLTSALGVEVRPGPGEPARAPLRLPVSALREVGFERDEAVLPVPRRGFLGYHLLQEYFALPEKFLFFDVTGLEALSGEGWGQTVEIVIPLAKEFPLARTVNAQTFRLHATPVVNLFRQLAEPVRLTQLQTEHRVIPDVRHQLGTEVHSILSVETAPKAQEAPVTYRPFYSFQHGEDASRPETYWYASRRASQKKDDAGTEVYLTLVDRGFRPSAPSGDDVLNVEILATNRDLPVHLPTGAAQGDFGLEGAGVFSSIRCLKKPTQALRAPLKRGARWRLASHLSLNYLSLVEQEEGAGPEALREILRLYDFEGSSVTRQQIEGITSVSARRVLRPIGSSPASFVRGLEVSLTLDETQFIGSGAYLMAAVLERFFALYASINSFSQLVASTRQREGTLRRWPPRAGDRIVL